MDDPSSALIGTILLALGAILIFGGYRNKKIFGQDGVVSTALSKGEFAKLDSAPQMFESFGTTQSTALGAIPGVVTAKWTLKQLEQIWGRLSGGGETTATLVPPAIVLEAFATMAEHEPYYAARLATEYARIMATGSNTKDFELIKLLLNGFRTSWGKPAGEYEQQVETVATSVKAITGVSV